MNESFSQQYEADTLTFPFLHNRIKQARRNEEICPRSHIPCPVFFWECKEGVGLENLILFKF